ALFVRELNELQRKRRCHRARAAGRQTIAFGIVFRQRALTIFAQRLCPWLVRNFFTVDQNLLVTPVLARHPKAFIGFRASEIQRAVPTARCRLCRSIRSLLWLSGEWKRQGCQQCGGHEETNLHYDLRFCSRDYLTFGRHQTIHSIALLREFQSSDQAVPLAALERELLRRPKC